MTQQTRLDDQPTSTKSAQDKPEAADKPKNKTTQPILTRGDKAEIIKRVKSEATTLMNPVEYEQAKVVARDIVASGSAPKSFQNEYQVLMAILAGREMNMNPMEALQSLYFVNGALNLWGKALPRRLREHSFQINYQDENANETTVVAHRGDEMYTETYTFDEAKDSGYTHSNGQLKIGWKPGVNRKLKLRYGALSVLIKSYIPEVLGSAAGIVEVDEDFDPDQVRRAAKNKTRKSIDKALNAKDTETLEDTPNKPVEQEQ